jgi:capsular polysaccharide biosynthesis protein
VAGLVVGVIVTAAMSTSYRAEATVVAGPSDGFLSVGTGSTVEPFTQTARTLLESDAVAGRAATQLGGAVSARSLQNDLSVTSRPESSALDVRFDASNQAKAVSGLTATLDAFTHLVRTRLTANPGQPAMRVVVFEPAHGVGKVAAPWARNIGIGAALGFLLGLVIAYVGELRRAGRYEYMPTEPAPARTDGAAARRVGSTRV